MSRWIELRKTSPSGKTTFMCRMCGRQTTTPDKMCVEPPSVNGAPAPASCMLLEEMLDAVTAVHTSTKFTSLNIDGYGGNGGRHTVRIAWTTADGQNWVGYMHMAKGGTAEYLELIRVEETDWQNRSTQNIPTG